MALRLAVQITGDAAGLREGTEQAARGLDELGERGARVARRLARQMDQAGRRIQAIGQRLAVAVTAPLVALGTVAVRAADVQIQAERRLAASIRAVGEAGTGQLEIFKEIAATLQSVTTVGDEVTLQNIQLARSMGLNAEQAARAARNAVALEGAFGRTADEAIRAAAALEQGRTEPLGEVLPTLIAIEDQSERVAEAQRLLGDAFQVATESARVGLGPMRQLANELGDLGEQFGKLILERINPFVERARALVRALQELPEETKRVIVRIGEFFAVLGPGLFVMGLFTRGLGLMATALVGLVGTLRRVVASVSAAMASLALAFTSPVGAAIAMSTAVVAVFVGFRDTLSQLFEEIFNAARTWLVDRFQQDIVRPFSETLTAMFETLPESLRSSIEEAMGLQIRGFEGLRERLAKLRETIVGPGPEAEPAALAQFRAIGREGETASRRIAEAFQADLDRIKGEFQGVIDGIKGRLPDGMWKAFFGDLEEVTPDIDRAQRRLAELMAQLPGGAAIAAAGGGAGAGTAAVEAGTGKLSALGELGDRLQGLGNPVRDLNEELRIGGGLSQRLGDSLGSAFQEAVAGGRELSAVLQGLLADLQNMLISKFVTGQGGLIDTALSGVTSALGLAGGGGVDLPLIGSKFRLTPFLSAIGGEMLLRRRQGGYGCHSGCPRWLRPLRRPPARSQPVRAGRAMTDKTVVKGRSERLKDPLKGRHVVPDGRSRIARDAEVKAAVDAMVPGPLTLKDMHRRLVAAFGTQRAPSRTSIARYVRRRRVALGFRPGGVQLPPERR